MSAESKRGTSVVSEKSKKSEILEAYNRLLLSIQDAKEVSPQEEKKRHEESEVVKQAVSLGSEKIAKSIMELKLSIIQELDSLEQKMGQQHRRLMDIETAINIETKNLHDLYEIKKSANSFSALVLAQKESRQTFESEMSEKKTLWDREQKEFERLRDENNENIAKECLRNEEEYRYNLELKRKKEIDFYEMRKKDLERELSETRLKFQQEISEREAAISAKENEFQHLQEQVEQFPQELEQAVKDTAKATKAEIEASFKHQIDLSNREIDGECKLTQQTISALQEKIKEQSALILQLTQRADESTSQVQEIALRALEGASNSRFHPVVSEDKKKQQQSSNT